MKYSSVICLLGGLGLCFPELVQAQPIGSRLHYRAPSYYVVPPQMRMAPGYLVRPARPVGPSTGFLGIHGRIIPSGMLVEYVPRGTEAWRAGIAPGDVVLLVDGQSIRCQHDWEEALVHARGGVACLTVRRGDCGAVERLHVQLDRFPTPRGLDLLDRPPYAQPGRERYTPSYQPGYQPGYGSDYQQDYQQDYQPGYGKAPGYSDGLDDSIRLAPQAPPPAPRGPQVPSGRFPDSSSDPHGQDQWRSTPTQPNFPPATNNGNDSPYEILPPLGAVPATPTTRSKPIWNSPPASTGFPAASY